MLVFLRFLYFAVSVDTREMDFNLLRLIYDHPSEFTYIKRQLLNGSYSLLQKGLIENVCNDGFCDTDAFRLTDNTINVFLDEYLDCSFSNLSVNLDKAFERRFLYKIEFEKPKNETQEAIWLSMIPDLTKEDVFVLVNNFDFSGGQIENIARKITIHRTLTGTNPLLNEIMSICNDEKQDKESCKKIGFAA